MRRLAAGMGVGVRSMPTGSFGWGGLMLKDPKPPMIPKETSLTTHPEASTKMYGINLRRGIILWIELPWPENPANTYTWHTETLDNCFGLIRSHQQCIYRDLQHWRSNQQPQIAEPKLYNWATVHITHKWCQILILLGKCGPGGDCVLCKEYGCKTHSGQLQVQSPWQVNLASIA